MKTKKLVSLLLVVAMVLTQIFVGTITVSAATTADGKFEYGLSNGEITISKVVTAKLTSDDLETLVIPEILTVSGTEYPVTTIGEWACNGRAIKSLSMPSVKTVGKNAFKECTSLSTVSMPLAETVNYRAFYGCSALTKVSMPAVKIIEDESFYACSLLKTVEMPNVQTIKKLSFGACSKFVFNELKHVKTLGQNAFKECKALVNISLPNLTDLGGTSGGAFYNCTALESVSIPKVTVIPKLTFYGCNKLSRLNSNYPGEIILPGATTSIGNQAFRACNSVKTVILSKSISTMGGSEFSNSTGLVNVYFPNNVSESRYNNFAGTGFSSATAFKTTINAYASETSYIREFVSSDGLNTETKSGKKIYNFIEENGDLLVMDGVYTDADGNALADSSNSVGFAARLFNTNTSSSLNVTAIICVISSDNELKAVNTCDNITIPAWKGLSLTCGEVNITNVDVANGDKIKVMFWVNTTDNLKPVVTQELVKKLYF